VSGVAPKMGRWDERRLRRATRADVLALIVIAILALAAVVTGRRARQNVEPREAVTLGGLLDELDLPLRLPNAPLVDADGKSTALLDRIRGQKAVVAFYAPWCGPCQKELPKLAEQIGDHADILVVVSADEDVESTRRALANLDLAKLGFFVDTSGQLQKEGRVTGLPTTFVVAKTGAVLARTVGFSFMELFRLTRRVVPQKEHTANVETVDLP
jgi:thiol-disulfide isomerase/thioredoxin